jgi:membrane protein implicated in regulation of membrane protease activity
MLLLLIAILLAILVFPTFMTMLGLITLAGMKYALLWLVPIMVVSVLIKPLIDVWTERRRRRASDARMERRRQRLAARQADPLGWVEPLD